jgi:hypothetical protein
MPEDGGISLPNNAGRKREESLCDRSPSRLDGLQVVAPANLGRDVVAAMAQVIPVELDVELKAVRIRADAERLVRVEPTPC